MKKFILKGERRQPDGSRAAVRLRREGWIPANVYGHGEENVHLQVSATELTRLVHEGHHMVTLEFDGNSDHGLLKEVQYDPLGGHILHADFTRVSMDEVVEMLVPVEPHGTAKGVSSGGILDVVHPEILLRGKARDLPERIPVEVTRMELADAVRIRDLTLPAGVEAVLSEDEPVLILHPPRGQETDEADEEATELEVIDEKKEEEGS